MADHVIDANWVKTSNVDFVSPASSSLRTVSRPSARGTRRCAGMPPPRDDRCYCPAGSAGSASYDCPEVTGHVAAAPDVSSDY
jgi:hypothetical protein